MPILPLSCWRWGADVDREPPAAILGTEPMKSPPKFLETCTARAIAVITKNLFELDVDADKNFETIIVWCSTGSLMFQNPTCCIHELVAWLGVQAGEEVREHRIFPGARPRVYFQLELESDAMAVLSAGVIPSSSQ